MVFRKPHIYKIRHKKIKIINFHKNRKKHIKTTRCAEKIRNNHKIDTKITISAQK